MLFVIDEARCQSLFEKPMPESARIAIGRLLSAHLDGQHIVVATPRICHVIENSNLFSEDHRAAAARVRGRYAELGGLSRHLRTWAKVVEATEIAPKRISDVWDVPLQWIASRPLHEAQLIGEDLNDIEALIGAADDYKNRSRLRNIRLRLGRRPGGGANTHRVLNDVAVVDQQIAVCIVDSDRLCPHSALGETAHKCMSVLGIGMFEVQITKGRSLENSIPWRLLDLVRPAMRPKPSDQAAELERTQFLASLYADLKRGYDRRALDGDAGLSHEPFWRVVELGRLHRTICCSVECQVTPPTQCLDKIYKACGASTLSDTASHLKASANNEVRSNQYIPSANSDDWLALGQVVFEYGAALPARRL